MIVGYLYIPTADSGCTPLACTVASPCRTPLASKRDSPPFVPRLGSADPLQIHKDVPSCPGRAQRDTPAHAQEPSQRCDASDDGDLQHKDSWCNSEATPSTRASPSPAGSEAGLSTPAWSDMEDDFLDCFVGSPLGSPEKPSPSLSDSPSPLLKVSDDSWAGARRQKQVVQLMKSIVGKLTEENCPRLSQQLTQCVETAVHMKTLVSLIIEFATSQHNLINLYTALLATLHKHFDQHHHLVGGSHRKGSFKRLLLLEFQQIFESISASEPEFGTSTKATSKMRAIGCTKLIGSLCVRGILESDVLVAFLGELLSQGTPEALESLAALLTIACPVFDKPDFKGHEAIQSTFDEVEAILNAPQCDVRCRILLTNVLHLRAQGWKDSAAVGVGAYFLPSCRR